MSSMRRVIASRLTESKRSAPHFYLSIDIDLEAVQVLRARLKQERGSAPSVNDFIVTSAGRALTQVPQMNARIEGNAIRQFSHANVGVAVALGSGGLVVPIVRNASALDVFEVGKVVQDFAARARSNKLLPDEYRGGTFTVSNLGMFGVTQFTAILNPPQAGILALGQAALRPVIRNGSVVAATILNATLSADHRVVDGAVGAQFLAALEAGLSTPDLLLSPPQQPSNSNS
jgi:pyruvate dehydrogenase E2 component (dihydrolipoamide acetyltransferase)